MTDHALFWFEIPVRDLERAARFYGAVLDAELATMDTGPTLLAMLPSRGGVGGALVQQKSAGTGYDPTPDGTLVYLVAGDDLNDALERVEPAGGEVLMPKTSLGENGFCAWIRDSEGNRVGLHAMG